MKKVLEIIGSLRVGGQENVGKKIGLHIDRSKYEIHYLVFDEEPEPYELELKAAGIKVFHLPEPSEGYIAYLRSLKKLIQQNSYSIIHAHTMYNCGWAMLVGKFMGVPCRISHSHSIKMADHHYSLHQQIYQFVMRYFIRWCGTDYIGCGKAAGAWLYGEKFFKKKGKIIYNGIDTEQFKYSGESRKRLRRELNLEDKFVVGHAGHFVEVKNQRFLISLMPEILRRRPEAVLVLLGEGRLREQLWRYSQEIGVEDRVIMTGNVSNVAEYLCAMDVFAFPSLYEGMPLAVIEVQCNGLPCIISDAVPDDVYLTDLVRPLSLNESKEKWVDKICGAKRKNEQQYSEMIKKTGFDTSEMLRNIYDIYDSVPERK